MLKDLIIEDGEDRSRIKVLSPDNRFFSEEIRDTQLYGDVSYSEYGEKQYILNKLLIGTV